MPAVLVDSGPLTALFDGRDKHHSRALRFIEAHRGPLVTNVAVLTEVCYLLDFSVEAQRDFLGWVEQAVELDARTPEDLGRIRQIIEKYADLPADFADASLVALAERRNLYDVATVDRDFTVYRGASRRRFRNVFLE